MLGSDAASLISLEGVLLCFTTREQSQELWSRHNTLTSASFACREFSGQSGGRLGAESPQRSAHSVGVLPGGGVQVGGHGGSRGLSVTKTSGLSSSKRRDAMRR